MVIAAGSSVAISMDNGATSNQHTAAAPVADIRARPDAIASLSNGKVIIIDAAGLTETADLTEEHQLR